MTRLDKPHRWHFEFWWARGLPLDIFFWLSKIDKFGCYGTIGMDVPGIGFAIGESVIYDMNAVQIQIGLWWWHRKLKSWNRADWERRSQ